MLKSPDSKDGIEFSKGDDKELCLLLLIFCFTALIITGYTQCQHYTQSHLVVSLRTERKEEKVMVAAEEDWNGQTG